MDKYEILKSRTIQFSLELNKNKLSDFLLQDIFELKESFQSIEILKKEIENKTDLKNLKLFLKENKKELKNGIYEYCLEEIREIKDDLEFTNSKNGKIIIELENWVLKIREKLKSEFKNKKIFIGRNLNEPMELIIGGIIKKRNDEKRIISFIERNKPPVKPIYYFENE